jgi:hypothetical protein
MFQFDGISMPDSSTSTVPLSRQILGSPGQWKHINDTRLKKVSKKTGDQEYGHVQHVPGTRVFREQNAISRFYRLKQVHGTGRCK